MESESLLNNVLIGEQQSPTTILLPSSYQSDFAVAIPERTTIQPCLLCSFPSELIINIVALTKQLMRATLNAIGVASSGVRTLDSDYQAMKAAFSAHSNAEVTDSSVRAIDSDSQAPPHRKVRAAPTSATMSPFHFPPKPGTMKLANEDYLTLLDLKLGLLSLMSTCYSLYSKTRGTS
jgi:hypothetical protein